MNLAPAKPIYPQKINFDKEFNYHAAYIFNSGTFNLEFCCKVEVLYGAYYETIQNITYHKQLSVPEALLSQQDLPPIL